jgi:hypothetical protein
MKYFYIILCFIFLSVYDAAATHIVGGVLSYECQGFNAINNTITIRITLRVYRDAINGQAPFDNPAIVGIYTAGSSTVFQTLQLNNPVITNAPIDLRRFLLMPPVIHLPISDVAEIKLLIT